MKPERIEEIQEYARLVKAALSGDTDAADKIGDGDLAMEMFVDHFIPDLLADARRMHEAVRPLIDESDDTDFSLRQAAAFIVGRYPGCAEVLVGHAKRLEDLEAKC